MNRIDQRENNQNRPITITPDYLPNAAGSCLIEVGNTKVICSCMMEEKTAPFLTGTGKGWLTSEYSMLPASTLTRKNRERTKADSRSLEIQRLIGRALRAAIDTDLLGERSIYIDCDVISADGGTRTASICGGYVALSLAVKKWLKNGVLNQSPIVQGVAAVSVGICNGEALLDLCYMEDSNALVDMNVVKTHTGGYVELQGTGEHAAFSKEQLDELLALADRGIEQIRQIQDSVIAAAEY